LIIIQRGAEMGTSETSVAKLPTGDDFFTSLQRVLRKDDRVDVDRHRRGSWRARPRRQELPREAVVSMEEVSMAEKEK
jgi:hypothetical protein